MQDVTVGTAAIPVNGRFCGRLMVVVELKGAFAYICDGKRRRIEKPKKKKLCHLSFPSTDMPPLPVDAGLTDGTVRRYLSAIRKRSGSARSGIFDLIMISRRN